MDLVSVIIPYYKKKEYISKSIKSVLDQTYENLEIIIIYDDENQNDFDFINKIKKKDKRILIIQNSQTVGAGESRNIGISSSNGKYVAFLDADDTWKKEKLNKQINFMKSNNYEITHTSYSIVDESHRTIGKRIARNFCELDELLKSCDIGTSTVIIKKNLISNNVKFASLKTKEDYVLWLKLLEKKNKIYGLDEILTFWTKSKNSLSSSIFQKLIDGFRVYYKYMNFNLFISIYYLIRLSINFLLKR